ncbi:MAG: alpha/beta hydrolase [Capsulimonadaceae bacterium]|nr:alpha/beta hydrolase [Capsulimonadaceae bacterium]
MPISQPDKETIELWPGGAPGALGTEPEDRPSITLYPPDPALKTGSAMVVLPGGGYGGHADHEGRPVAEWLNSIGIFAAVLQYRLGPRYHHPCMVEDACRAIRTVRYRAKEWELDANHVGILGFSAGGHLTASATTLATPGNPSAADPIDRLSSRPDVSVPIYAVMEMRGPYSHDGSRLNLLGENPPDDLIDLLTPRLHVTKDTPPTLLLHAVDDAAVPMENTLLYALALSKARVPYQIQAYQNGGHGFGMGTGNPILSRWPDDAALWLKSYGF